MKSVSTPTVSNNPAISNNAATTTPTVTAGDERVSTDEQPQQEPSACNNGGLADQVAGYLDSFPSGYRFLPTDEELITHYLLKKIKNETLPPNKMNEAEVYAHHPNYLSANYPQATEGVWYFFSSRDRKYAGSKRARGDAGPGYWKLTGSVKDIKDKEVKVGEKKLLEYLEGLPPNGTKTMWLMQEYVAEGYERHSNDMKLDDHVLCKIYKTVRTIKVTDKQPHVASYYMLS